MPELRRGEVLVRVRTTGIPAHEVSGVVERRASDVTDFRPGDEVHSLTDFPRDGAAAEFVAVRSVNLALKPHSISHAQASADRSECGRAASSAVGDLSDDRAVRAVDDDFNVFGFVRPVDCILMDAPGTKRKHD
jgi:hypothetical protein